MIYHEITFSDGRTALNASASEEAFRAHLRKVGEPVAGVRQITAEEAREIRARRPAPEPAPSANVDRAEIDDLKRQLAAVTATLDQITGVGR